MPKKIKAKTLNPIRYPVSHEVSYRFSINKLINSIFKTVNSEIERLLPTSNEEYQSIIDSVFSKFMEDKDFGSEEANNFVKSLFNYHGRMYSRYEKYLNISAQGFEALKPSTALERYLDRAIGENVNLIVTIPTKLLPQVKEEVANSFNEFGFDKDRLNKAIKKRFNVSKSRARLIARDQTNKTISNLTEIRHRALGITEYKWRGTLDQRERQTHLDLEGQKFSYSAPPAIGNPGQPIQCRCYPEVIIPTHLLL